MHRYTSIYYIIVYISVIGIAYLIISLLFKWNIVVFVDPLGRKYQHSYQDKDAQSVVYSADDVCSYGLPGLYPSLSHHVDSCRQQNEVHIDFELLQQSDEYDNINHHFRETLMPLAVWMESCGFRRDARRVCHLGRLASEYTLTYHEGAHIGTGSHQLILNSILSRYCSTVSWVRTSYSTYLLDWTLGLLSPQGSCRVVLKTDHVVGSVERELVGVPRAVKLRAFRSIREGAHLYLNATEKPVHKAASPPHRNVVLYTREDVKRRMVGAEGVAAELGRELLSLRYRVRVVRGLDSLDAAQLHALFASTTVLIAPHGGWTPNVLFMPDNATVFSLDRRALGAAAVDVFLEWDYFFDSPWLRMYFVGNTSRVATLAASRATLDTSRFLSCDLEPPPELRANADDVAISNLTAILSVIRNTS